MKGRFTNVVIHPNSRETKRRGGEKKEEAGGPLEGRVDKKHRRP